MIDMPEVGSRKSEAGKYGLTIKKVFILFSVSCLLFSTLGCEAFARKFTRKSKKTQHEEMVLAPEEWKGPKASKPERYEQYFIYWRSWQNELSSAFLTNTSQKKKIDCAQQAKKNLVNMRFLLNESKQRQLDVYLKQLEDLLGGIKSDIYGSSNNSFRETSERLKNSIELNFAYSHVKNDIPL